MRKSIPLVIGGWGTRGKSGTERLKAGLFQGLGYECLVKTTGCEAMVIHAIPGMRAREIFLYRPYDKATIWEQRDVLELGHRLGVDVFLWECMALQPDLVDLLQAQWMRDDYSTITNAYPDHEDVQGPSGYDVAECISQFVPTAGHLFTSEDQMLPLLRERADERDTTLRAVSANEAEMISEELLDRFPYREHPRNVALVASLAAALGIDPSVAICEMADHVVPDLGVLKTYPTLTCAGRRLVFTNGMSANERTGALANWQRMGFDAHDPEREPGRFIVTVVNNRADRLARSEVFARFLVDDVAAHRHVLIGTNVRGLVGFVRAALERRIATSDPTLDLGSTPGDAAAAERRRVAHARLDRTLAWLKIASPDAASVRRELEALGVACLGEAEIAPALAPASLGETYGDASADVSRHLSGCPAWANVPPAYAPFVVAAIARRRTARGLRALLEQHVAEGAPAERFRAAYRGRVRELFEESLVVIEEPRTPGDAILERIALAVPPTAEVQVMGLQNIKGTGLDFVYRWVSHDAVTRLLKRLASPLEDERRDALRALVVHGDYGAHDARLACDAVAHAGASDPARDRLPYEDVRRHLEAVLAAKQRATGGRRASAWSRRARLLVGMALDHLDAIGRRAKARRVMNDLVAGRLSHDEAEGRMRALVARQKGAWALRGAEGP